MKIKSIELVCKASKPEQFPVDTLPEITFAGRSNVGKSSMINTLVGRKRLAQTSSTPGRTRAIFFYMVNSRFYLVDLPGYGYAKVSKELRHDWGQLMDSYFTSRRQLHGCVHIVDIRHEPTDQDRQMTEMLNYFQLPYLLVATKADKISRGRYQQHLEIIRQKLEPPADTRIIPFSIRNQAGKEETWQFVQNCLNMNEQPFS